MKAILATVLIVPIAVGFVIGFLWDGVLIGFGLAHELIMSVFK